MAKKIQLQDKYGNDRYPITTADCVVDSNGNILSDVLKNTYVMPLGGIPKSDLSDNVRASLEKADSALQSIPSDYITETILSGKNYATKEDIKGFVTKGSTLGHYGITDAVIYDGAIDNSTAYRNIGYGYPAGGWPTAGASMSIGASAEYHTDVVLNADNPRIRQVAGTAGEWRTILTSANAGYHAIGAARDGRNLLATDTLAMCGYVYGENGWKTTGPALITNRGGYSGLFNFAITNTTTNPDAFNLYINVNYGGTLGNWAKVLTDKDTGTMQVRGRYADGDANDFLSAGSYEVWGGGAISNVPSGHGTILISRGSASNMYFTSQLLTDAQGHLYSRMSEGSAANWRDWRTIIDDNNISQYAITQITGDARYLKLSGGTLTGQLYVETSTGDRYIHSKCSTAHIAFGIGSGGNNRGIFDINDGKWWIVRNNSDDTEIVSSTMSLVGKVNVTGVLEARSGITLGNVTRISWPVDGISKDAKLLPTNSFDNGGQLGINFLNNALYAADKRFTVEGTGFSRWVPDKIFSNNYEDACYVPAGTTATLTISNNGSSIISGYPYGEIFLSFYYTNVPESVTVEVYCNHESQGIGWKTLSRASVRGHNSGVWAYTNGYYNVTQLRITITASSSIGARLCQIDWFLSRGSLSNLPVVTKFGIDQELWGRLICNGGITLGNKTITSWSDLNMQVIEQTATSGISIAPNVLNRWTTPLTGNLTINFSAGSTGVANYYMVEFKTGGTIPTINLPSGITWQGGDNLLARLKPYRTYQISILNNLAVGGEF